jgi:hypothetical protein
MRLENFLRYGERRAFAAKVGCSKSNIDRICCGTLQPSPPLAAKIVEACKAADGTERVSLSDLPGYTLEYPVNREKKRKKPAGQDQAAG